MIVKFYFCYDSDLPQYGHKQWQSYFGRTFDVYTKLWKFQQQNRYEHWVASWICIVRNSCWLSESELWHFCENSLVKSIVFFADAPIFLMIFMQTLDSASTTEDSICDRCSRTLCYCAFGVNLQYRVHQIWVLFLARSVHLRDVKFVFFSEIRLHL